MEPRLGIRFPRENVRSFELNFQLMFAELFRRLIVVIRFGVRTKNVRKRADKMR